MILIKIILTILATLLFLGFLSFPFIDNIEWNESGIVGKFFSVCFVFFCVVVVGFVLFIIGTVVYAILTSIWLWKW